MGPVPAGNDWSVGVSVCVCVCEYIPPSDLGNRRKREKAEGEMPMSPVYQGLLLPCHRLLGPHIGYPHTILDNFPGFSWLYDIGTVFFPAGRLSRDAAHSLSPLALAGYRSDTGRRGMVK
jgi:hypothetical protein